MRDRHVRESGAKRKTALVLLLSTLLLGVSAVAVLFGVITVGCHLDMREPTSPPQPPHPAGSNRVPLEPEAPLDTDESADPPDDSASPGEDDDAPEGPRRRSRTRLPTEVRGSQPQDASVAVAPRAPRDESASERFADAPDEIVVRDLADGEPVPGLALHLVPMQGRLVKDELRSDDAGRVLLPPVSLRRVVVMGNEWTSLGEMTGSVRAEGVLWVFAHQDLVLQVTADRPPNEVDGSVFHVTWDDDAEDLDARVRHTVQRYLEGHRASFALEVSVSARGASLPKRMPRIRGFRVRPAGAGWIAEPSAVPLAAEAGDTVYASLALRSAIVLSGRVRVGDDGASDAAVSVFSMDGNRTGPLARVRAATDGSFQIGLDSRDITGGLELVATGRSLSRHVRIVLHDVTRSIEGLDLALEAATRGVSLVWKRDGSAVTAGRFVVVDVTTPTRPVEFDVPVEMDGSTVEAPFELGRRYTLREFRPAAYSLDPWKLDVTFEWTGQSVIELQ